MIEFEFFIETKLMTRS